MSVTRSSPSFAPSKKQSYTFTFLTMQTMMRSMRREGSIYILTLITHLFAILHRIYETRVLFFGLR